MTTKTGITPKTNLMEAFRKFAEVNSSWASNTIRVYNKNINDIVDYMADREIEPILENVTYELGKTWISELEEFYSPKSIQQKLATLVSMFSHYNRIGVITGNPFSVIKVNDYTDERHSDHLNINEFRQMYKAAIELEEEGIPVLIAVHLAMFTSFRNSTLKKLKVKSISIHNGGVELKVEKKKTQHNPEKELTKRNSKNNELFIPLPPKLLLRLEEYIDGRDLEESLLYGLQGKPLANKQFNYIVKRVCEHLRWTSKDKVGEKATENTQINFTPHGFRYTLTTLISEMGVPDDSIRYLLGHSEKFFKGNVTSYILTNLRQVKEIRAAQVLLETLIETALELEGKGIQLDLNSFSLELPRAYDFQKKNNNYVNIFRESILQYAYQKQYEMMRTGGNETSYLTYIAPELPNQYTVQLMNQMYSNMHQQQFMQSQQYRGEYVPYQHQDMYPQQYVPGYQPDLQQSGMSLNIPLHTPYYPNQSSFPKRF